MLADERLVTARPKLAFAEWQLRRTTGRALAASTAVGLVTLSAVSFGSETPRFDLDKLEAHVRYLSSDDRRGRGNGTEGLEEASEYIARELEALGLVAAGDEGTYFQNFDVMVDKEIGQRTDAAFHAVGRSWNLRYPSDFTPMTFSSGAELEAPLVFVGYGVTAPERDYDDYEGIDVDGKIALVLRYVPRSFEKHGWHATFVRKAKNAVSRGAAGLVIVNGPLHSKKDELVPFGVDVGLDHIDIPVIHVRRQYVEDVLARAKALGLRELQERINDNLSPFSFELEGVSADLSIDIRNINARVRNVLAYLPPSGGRSSLEAEHIIVGAHYDHLGLGHKGSRDRRARGEIHNGADDNASGVAGLLELARVLSGLEERPRGVLFAAFAGEELGLRGSNHYTANATLPLEKAVAMLNLDMIGRLRHDRIYLGGVDLLPQVEPVVEDIVASFDMTFSTRFPADGASDHASFIRVGVPALFLFTGLHGDYHKPSDDPQFINFDGMARVLELGLDISEYFLRAEERPVLVASRRRRGGSGGGSHKEAYVGVGVDNNFRGKGVRFSYVASGSPAAEAGLKAGDVLLELEGKEIHSNERAAAILQNHRPGETVRAKVRRDGRVFEVKVRLSSWP